MIDLLLMSVGGVLLAVWAGVTLWGELAGRWAVAEFQTTLEVPDQALWSESRKRDYLESLDASSGAALGVMRVHRLGIEVPVYDGVSEFNLNRGVARIDGTAGMEDHDNLGIAGHRDGYFRALKDVKPGDVVALTTRGGVREYEVFETLIVEPMDVWVLEPSDTATLTLVTCFPFYFVGSAPQRFIVRAAILASG